MKFKDGKTFSAYVRPKLHRAYITIACKVNIQRYIMLVNLPNGKHF